MSLPYETATAGDRALLELQKMLAKFGCASFGTAVDIERGVTIVSFRWRDQTVRLDASWKGYAAALIRARYGATRHWDPSKRMAQDNAALEQARISVCSVLRDWAKAQITAVEAGVLTFEAAFMPHMLLKDGRRLVDAVVSQGLLPPPNDEGAS